MTNIKYTIITPMYNSFDLMNNYFLSLENQTYKNFEVIVIDDCSTDDSYKKICNYAKKSNLKLKILKSDINNGPGNARNIGMIEAKGEWITFIDNDDWISCNMLEIIDNIIENNDVNCIVYDYYIQTNEKTRVARSMYKGYNGIMKISDCISNIRNHAIGKIYKTSILRDNKIYYPKLKRCEDVAFVCRAVEACEVVYYLTQPLYYYCQRSTSLSNNIQLDEQDMITAFGIIEESLGEKYPKELAEKSVFDLLYGVLLIMCKCNKKNIEIKEYIGEYESKYPNWINYESTKNLNIAKKVFLISAKLKLIYFMKILTRMHGKIIG